MLWLCDIRLAAVGSGVRKARNLVDVLGLSLTDEARDDLRLLISEVVTNAVRHGRTGEHDAGAPIRVRVGLDDTRLRVEVHDRGPGFQPEPRGPTAKLDSGWGVHFVDQLADRWGVGRQDDHWVVWFELRLPRHPDAASAVADEQRAEDGAATPKTDRSRTLGLGDLARIAQAA